MIEDNSSSDIPQTAVQPGGASGEVAGSGSGTPVGNAPAASKWPLVLFGVAWLLWILFLALMASSRTDAGVS